MKHTQDMDKLFQAILTLKDTEECYQLFEDICTIKELEALVQRFQVVQALDAGMNYNEVSENTGASSATISRVSKCLNYGSGGYRLVLKRLKDKERNTNA